MNQEEIRHYRKILSMVGGICSVACIAVLLFFRTSVLYKIVTVLFGVLTPFVYGAVIAYLLKPVCRTIEKWLGRLIVKLFRKEHAGLVRIISILLSLGLMFAVLILLLMAVLPQLIESITSIITQLPGAAAGFEEWIRSLDKDELSHEIVVYVQQLTDTVSQHLNNFLQTDLLPDMQNLVTNVTSSFSGILSFLLNFGLGCVVAAYLLGSWERFKAQAKLIVYALFRKDHAEWIRKEVHFTDKMFSGFVHGKFVDSLIIGLICFVFMTVMRMPYGLLISIIVGVTNIIPFFGPYLGAIPSAILVLTASPAKALIFIIFIILLQQFDGNILGPKILGDRVGLSGFWILFAILFASSFWGIGGMLVGVPVFAVIYDLIRSVVLTLLHKRGEDDLAEDYYGTYRDGVMPANYRDTCTVLTAGMTGEPEEQKKAEEQKEPEESENPEEPKEPAEQEKPEETKEPEKPEEPEGKADIPEKTQPGKKKGKKQV